MSFSLVLACALVLTPVSVLAVDGQVPVNRQSDPHSRASEFKWPQSFIVGKCNAVLFNGALFGAGAAVSFDYSPVKGGILFNGALWRPAPKPTSADTSNPIEQWCHQLSVKYHEQSRSIAIEDRINLALDQMPHSELLSSEIDPVVKNNVLTVAFKGRPGPIKMLFDDWDPATSASEAEAAQIEIANLRQYLEADGTFYFVVKDSVSSTTLYGANAHAGIELIHKAVDPLSLTAHDWKEARRLCIVDAVQAVCGTQPERHGE